MEDERSKKLAAGRDRLAKFQKKKKKKKTKEPKAPDPEKVQDTTVESAPSFYEDRPNGTDSVDEFSAGSSDLLGSNSDILSSLSEIDQRSIGTDDLCQDSDASQLDAEVARLELGEARSRIHQLEESLLGKQTALTLLQNELSELRSKVNNNTDHSTTNGQVIEDNQNTQVNGSNQEAELRAALEQYNIKIQEFQQALKQRDEVIEQLTANMQTVAQSRDAVQADATAQINQLSGHIQTLQDQLKQTGESLSNQSREQVSSLAEELGLAQNQVTALQQNVADKDAIMKQLADRYTQKAQEVIELAEERDDMKRKNHGEISALQQKLKEATGEVSPVDREDSLLKLQAELDESYGSQIVMIKQQLEDKHQQELGLWKQRYDEMERIAAASSDSNLMRTELENQLKEANERLAEKDKEILVARGDNENLSLKLANLAASHQKHLDELEANHRNELDFVREEAKKRTQEHLDEVQKELESTQGELDTSLSELEEERKKSAEVEEELAEKALNTSSLQDNLTKEIGILATELKRKDDEIQELNQLKELLAEAEATNESLRQELEAERQREQNHENGPSAQTEALEDADQDKLESLRQSLDEGNRKILEEVLQERDDANNEKMDQMKEDLESQHKQEQESLKAAAEAVYSSQLDDQLARSEQEKSQALVEQLRALQESQEQELAAMRKNWAEREEEYERRFEGRDEIDGFSTGELIGHLQRRLSKEHQQTLQDLVQDCDQVSLDYLAALREKMENEHLQELAEGDPHQQVEGDISRPFESGVELDDEALIAEREKVVAHSEEIKKRLDSLQTEGLAGLRASMQADYDALVKAKEELEKSKSQTEESLRQELEGLRDAFEDLQQKYAEERESAVNRLVGDDMDAAGLVSQLQSEVEELQRELTQQRKKLQDDHTEELSKLKAYFETELSNTEEKWLKEMEKIEDLKGGNTSLELESSVEEPDVVSTKRPDLPHSLMTLTHISDTDSSPPRSPVKPRDTEAEFRQQLRSEVERDYLRGLENLRNELENEHKAEIARISLEHDLKHEQSLTQEKDALTRKHEHEMHKLEMKHLEALENLRKELDDHYAREIARVRMEAAGEMAKMVEEERANAKEDYKQQLAEAVEETKQKMQQQAAKDAEELQSRLEEEHRQALEKLMEDHVGQDEGDKIQQALENLREQLTTEHEEDKARAIEELKAALEESKAKEFEEFVEKHEVEAKEKADREATEREEQVERVKEQLAAEHEEDKASALEELRINFEESKAKEIEELLEKHDEEAKEKAKSELEEREEELSAEYAEKGEKALEELKVMLQESNAKEIEKLTEKHLQEIKELAERGAKEREDLKASYDQRWNEEKAEMNRVLEEQLKQFGDADSLLEQLRENHEQEKVRLKEELTKEHMEKFEEVTTELEAGHLKQLEEMRDKTKQLVEEDYLEKMKALEEELRESYEKEVEEMNRKNEEDSRRTSEEFDEKMKAAALDTKRDIENAKMELEEAHQQEIQEIEARHLASLEEEKGSLDARLQERDAHWKAELKQHEEIQQKLLDEINQVQEEKATLVNRHSVEQTRRKREHEETTNLISMLRSDLNNLNTERGTLLEANNNLLQVLAQAVQAVIRVEETISRRLRRLDGHRRSSADGQEDRPPPTGGGSETPSNTSLLSADEGLELSQGLSESVFAGPDLDAEAEELVINVTSRLQSSVQALLERINQLPDEPRVQVVEESLVQAGQAGAQASPPPGDLPGEENKQLEERLEEESQERQRLTAELDRMQGLLQGLQADRDAQEQSLGALEEEKLAVVIDLETARNAKKAAEAELQSMGAQQAQLQKELERLQNQPQKDMNDEKVTALQEENESLRKESDSVQRKAKKDRDTLQAKIQELEATHEDLSSKWERETESKNLVIEDLQNQLEAANKIVKADKDFLQQQGMEREQERDDFQKEIARLEGLLGKEKSNNHEEEDLKKQLEELEKENADLHQTSEELAHEKEALQRQCYEQLHQISALQSKLDAHKHGLGNGVPEEEPSSDVDDVSEASLASVTLTQQLEQEREALERKGSEIKALEEQLDQFREDLVSKEDEISQLKLQLDISDKASLKLQDDDPEKLQLRVQLDRAEETIFELRQRLDQDSPSEEPSPHQREEELLQAREAHAEEIRHLTARHQEALSQMEENLERKLEAGLKEKLQGKDTEVLQLKIQLDQEEETVLDLRQQLARESTEPSALRTLQQELEQIREDHHRAVEELERNHQEIVARMEEEHKNEVAGMLAAQEEDWKKIRELENEYQGKIGHLGSLSPGKTLQEKLDEIKTELTAQHQQHIADIQRTMEQEAEERVQQVKAQTSQDAILREQRHQHELEEAILRTNRDLLAAHAEEVNKLREDHRQEVERLLTASPANISQIGDLSHIETDVGGRPSSVAQGLPPQTSPGAGEVMTEGLSEKLKTILTRLRGEGLSLLSLSELRYLHDQTAPRPPLQQGASFSAIQDAWDNERRALKDGLQALGDLITQINTTQLKSDAEMQDWRGELLHAIQHVFHTQRDALRAELATGVAMSGDQNITQLQLLERRIRDQENFHKSAVEQIYGADRASILGETRDLHGQNASLREELQRSRQKLTQQLRTLEDMSSKRERQLKRQLETMEHKYRQERILVEDLRTSLALEKEKSAQLSEVVNKVKGQYEEQQEEVGDLLTKIDRQTAEQETLESRLTDMTAAFEAERSQNQTLNTTIADERKASRNLQESFESENYRLNRARTQEQRIIKELHREIQAVKDKLVQAEQIAEREGQRATSLAKDLEAIRAETVTEVQHEKARFTELKTSLDVEKSRCQELKTALQREQALNAQLHSTIEQERQATAEASLQDKGALADVQGSLEKSQAELLKVQGQCQQLENSIQRKEGILDTERRQHKESLAQERAGARQLKSALDGTESQLAETRRQLSYEQEKNARLTAEKERLKHSQDHLAQEESGRELQRERERESEKRRQLEREREREVDRQKLRDLELAHQLAQQRIEALKGEVEDWRGQAQIALEELQAAQEKKNHEEEEEEELEEMEQALEKEFKDSQERLGPASRESKHSFNQFKEQLEAVRQRLQLIAVRQSEGLALLRRLNQSATGISTSTRQEIHGLERNLQEVTAELRHINGALILQTETSNGVPASQSRLNSRLLIQNAELTDYITKLSEDKSAVRRQVAQLEEQLWSLRHRSSTSPRGNIAGVVAEERASWDRERATIQNSLRQAEREIIRLKLDLEHTARESEADLQPNGSSSQSKYQRLYGKYLRAESFRKSLVYQKRYLLLLLGGFQHTEEAALALIARMGGYPNPSNMPQAPRRHSAAFTKFRSAVRVVIAVSRLKYLRNKWHRARGSSRAESRAQSRSSQRTGISPNLTPPRVTHSSASGATPPVFHPPGRMGTGFGSGMSPPSFSTPPVRERSYQGNDSLVNGTHYHTSHSFRSTLSCSRARRSLSPGDQADQSDASLSQYIRRLENLQERIPTDGRSEQR